MRPGCSQLAATADSIQRGGIGREGAWLSGTEPRDEIDLFHGRVLKMGLFNWPCKELADSTVWVGRVRPCGGKNECALEKNQEASAVPKVNVGHAPVLPPERRWTVV